MKKPGQSLCKLLAGLGGLTICPCRLWFANGEIDVPIRAGSNRLLPRVAGATTEMALPAGTRSLGFRKGRADSNSFQGGLFNGAPPRDCPGRLSGGHAESPRTNLDVAGYRWIRKLFHILDLIFAGILESARPTHESETNQTRCRPRLNRSAAPSPRMAPAFRWRTNPKRGDRRSDCCFAQRRDAGSREREEVL
jgi:hypothetical protein